MYADDLRVSKIKWIELSVLRATAAKMVHFAAYLGVADSVTENHGVAGSIPALGTITSNALACTR